MQNQLLSYNLTKIDRQDVRNGKPLSEILGQRFTMGLCIVIHNGQANNQIFFAHNEAPTIFKQKAHADLVSYSFQFFEWHGSRRIQTSCERQDL